MDYFTHGSGTFKWASDAFHGGSRSVRVVTSQPAGSLARWLSKTTRIPATPGTLYTASAWLRTSGVTQYAQLTINFWNSSSTHLGSFSSSSVTGTANWTQRSVQATAPANTAFIRVEFRLYGPGTLWADDVVLTK